MEKSKECKSTCGIYKITNKINGHAYIGLSKNIEKRFADHKIKAFHSEKKDDLDKVLYKAFRKYGLDNFTFEIIEECSEDKLKEREIYWIDFYNTYKDRQHYNETPGGDLPGFNTAHLGEDHGKAVLTEEQVCYCRQCYKEGKRSKDIYNELQVKDKITYSGFLNMWHGRTWKHIMPEVFEVNPHRAKYTEVDCEIIREAFLESGLTLSKFVKTEACYVGYGTAYRMVHEPSFYKGK